MHGEMGKQTVSFAGGHRQQGFLHVVKHLAEQTEIKVRRAVVGIAQAGDASRHGHEKNTPSDSGGDHASPSQR